MKMGAWGTQTFENDQAGDWLVDFEASDDPSAMIREALIATSWQTSHGACIALAAAEALACARGVPAADAPEELLRTASSIISHASVSEVSMAIEVLGHVIREGELFELWQGQDGFEEWRAGVEDLLTRLRRVTC